MDKKEYSGEDEDFSLKGFFFPITNIKAIHALVIIGILVYFSSLFNPFILDDYSQIVNNEALRNVGTIPFYFLKGQVFSNNILENMLNMHYKPLFFSTYSFIYFFSGNNPFLFHLFQLTLYIANSILIFLIFSRFFHKTLAFCLSLLMLVHPLNSEVAIYIADLQDVLFMFFGLFAFYIISKRNHVLRYKDLVFISLLFLCSLLSKETGALFLVIYLIYTWFFSRINFKGVGLSVFASIVGYTFLRFLASMPPILAIKSESYIQSAPYNEVLLSIPKIFYYYISKLFYPVEFAVGQVWLVREANFSNFYFPLIIDIAVVIAFIVFGRKLYRRNGHLFKQYIFFTAWFWLGMLAHMQIFIQLDFIVADRWFYFPIIGLFGAVGTIAFAYKEQIKNKNITSLLIYSFVALTIVFSWLTFIRISQWQSAITLYSNEVKYAENPKIYNFYGALLMASGKLNEAKPYFEKSIAMDPYLGNNVNNLAKFYAYKKDIQKAKESYMQNIKRNKTKDKSTSYVGLAQIALFVDKNALDAKRNALLALKEANANRDAIFYLAVAEYQLGNKENSLKLAEKLYTLLPNQRNKELYLLIKNDKLVSVSDPMYGKLTVE